MTVALSLSRATRRGLPRFSSIFLIIPDALPKWVDAREKCWRRILRVDMLLKGGALYSTRSLIDRMLTVQSEHRVLGRGHAFGRQSVSCRFCATTASSWLDRRP